MQHIMEKLLILYPNNFNKIRNSFGRTFWQMINLLDRNMATTRLKKTKQANTNNVTYRTI